MNTAQIEALEHLLFCAKDYHQSQIDKESLIYSDHDSEVFARILDKFGDKHLEAATAGGNDVELQRVDGLLRDVLRAIKKEAS